MKRIKASLGSNFVFSFVASRHAVTTAMVLATLLFAALPQAHADNITINSSSAVTFLDSGSYNNDFGAPFTAANFAAAQTGPAASVLTSTPFYSAALTGTQWIGTNSSAGDGQGDTALYAISFNLPSGVTSASLVLSYLTDNNLGYTNPGVYINGTALPNTIPNPCGVNSESCFQTASTYTDSDISSLLVSGTNWLYLDSVNLGGPAGLDFSATIDYTPATGVPEASTLALFGSGLLGLLGLAVRGKRFAPTASC